MVVLLEKQTLVRLVTFLVLLHSPIVLLAAGGMWDSVFIYQQKMANYGQPKAQLKLGEMYEEGHGTEQNFDEAEKWYRKALKQGFSPAQEKLEQLQQRRQQQGADAIKAKQEKEKENKEKEKQAELAREKAEKEQLGREAEQKVKSRRAEKKRVQKAAAAEKERIGRKRAQEAMDKMMAVPDAYDE